MARSRTTSAAKILPFLSKNPHPNPHTLAPLRQFDGHLAAKTPGWRSLSYHPPALGKSVGTIASKSRILSPRSTVNTNSGLSSLPSRQSPLPPPGILFGTEWGKIKLWGCDRLSVSEWTAGKVRVADSSSSPRRLGR